jgi:response regulator NasT
MDGTRIVLADSEKGLRKQLRETLKQAGYLVVGEAGDAKTVLHLVSQTEPELLVLDADLPGFEELQLIRVLEERRVVPVVLTIPYDHRLIAGMAAAGGVFGVLTKPVQEAALFAIIESALVNFRRVKDLEKENRKLQRELETRKVVERAKGLLMEKRNMSERDAFRYLQKLSMDRCVSMMKVAKQVIMSMQA